MIGTETFWQNSSTTSKQKNSIGLESKTLNTLLTGRRMGNDKSLTQSSLAVMTAMLTVCPFPYCSLKLKDVPKHTVSLQKQTSNNNSNKPTTTTLLRFKIRNSEVYQTARAENRFEENDESTSVAIELLTSDEGEPGETEMLRRRGRQTLTQLQSDGAFTIERLKLLMAIFCCSNY